MIDLLKGLETKGTMCTLITFTRLAPPLCLLPVSSLSVTADFTVWMTPSWFGEVHGVL